MNKTKGLTIMLMLLLGSLTAGAQGLKDAYKDYFLIGVAVNQRNVTNEAKTT